MKKVLPISYQLPAADTPYPVPVPFIRQLFLKQSDVYMIIWVDADSCPAKVRGIIAKAAERNNITAFFVANRSIPVPHNRNTKEKIVAPKESAADDYICDQSSQGDIAVTRDILLAERLIRGGVWVINDSGTILTSENIRQRVSERNFMKALKMAGTIPPQQNRFGHREIKRFSDALDKLLHRVLS